MRDSFVRRYPNFSDSIGQMGLYLLGFTCRLQHTAIYRAFVRGYSNFSNCFGQMLSILQCLYLMTIFPRLTNILCNHRTKGFFTNETSSYFHLTSSQSLSDLQLVRQNTKNHQSYHAFCSLKISPVEDFSITLRKINVIGLR